MKKKWIVGVLAVLFVTAPILGACQHEASSSDTETVSIAKDCWEHVTDINIAEQEDGTAEVVLTAPDYVSLVKLLAGKSDDAVTGKDITKAVKNNPKMVKEYTFTASSPEEDDVKNALMEQISYDLVALTLEGMIGG